MVASHPLPWLPMPGELMSRSGLAARYTTSMPVATKAVRRVRPGRPIATQADENHPQEHRGLDDQQSRGENRKNQDLRQDHRPPLGDSENEQRTARNLGVVVDGIRLPQHPAERVVADEDREGDAEGAQVGRGAHARDPRKERHDREGEQCVEPAKHRVVGPSARVGKLAEPSRLQVAPRPKRRGRCLGDLADEHRPRRGRLPRIR